MGKTRNGEFIPPKGRPSGDGRGKGLTDAFAVNSDEKDRELTEKYLNDPDEPAANVHTRHHNRNTDKGRTEQSEENR